MKIDHGFMQSICDGIAAHFGNNCEVVYHDLTKNYDHTIVAIANGHVTGRAIGGPGTNEGLKALKSASKAGSHYTYLTHTKDGKTLKTTSLYFRDKKDCIIGSLCINYDISDIVGCQSVMENFVHCETNENSNEYFSNDISEVLDDIIVNSMNHIGKPLTKMTRKDKINAIRYLDERGAFLVKRAGERVCEKLAISKHSFYAYLEEVRR